jgi:hypothetical protein
VPRPRLDGPSDETVEQKATRLRRRAALQHQVREEIRFAAAGRSMTLAEVSRRMGDPTGRALSAGDKGGGMSLAKIADVGTAMGVTFRLTAIPDTEIKNAQTLRARPDASRMFTPEQVREIRRRSRSGESRASLGREFGVSPSLIFDIATGRAYRDVADE